MIQERSTSTTWTVNQLPVSEAVCEVCRLRSVRLYVFRSVDPVQSHPFNLVGVNYLNGSSSITRTTLPMNGSAATIIVIATISVKMCKIFPDSFYVLLD